MKIVCIFFVVGILSHHISAEELSSGQASAIQIVSPVNHSFHLDMNELRHVLEADGIKDRHKVIVSIAGAFRQGKSFLLNFFIRYLEAQYKKHDVSDWLDETGNNSKLNGFKFRGGRNRETVGIWMWSDIFTHDFPNGDKVAIILIDTQGIFDDRSSVHDCTVIFALSLLMSSVQCYNLMQNIREDDLQHLDLFTEYGRLAVEQTQEKPFQKLLFIVRDWPFAFETPYGNGQKIVDEVFVGNNEQTAEMQDLRKRIAVSFQEIGAYLMPHPGLTVAHSQNFTGDLQQISQDFKTHVKALVESLFAPENLIVKQINGQKVRAQDVSQYLQAYTDIFNNGTLPEPKSVLMATAEASNTILSNECLRYYSDEMVKTLEKASPYMEDNQLIELHKKTKSEAMEKYVEKPTLGGDELRTIFQNKIENSTEHRFLSFKADNERRRKDFIEKANLQNEKISAEIVATVKRRILDEIERSGPLLNYSHSNSVFQTEMQHALADFNSRKMGNNVVSNNRRDQLKANLDNLRNMVAKILESYTNSLQSYSNAMHKALNEVAYFSHGDFINLHQRSKNAVIAQFQSRVGDNEFKAVIQRIIETNIEQKKQPFEGTNEAKRRDFLKRANLHSEAVSRELKAAFENRVRGEIGRSFLSDDRFFNLFSSTKQNILEQFASRKMGENELSNQTYQHFRVQLERDIDSLQYTLKKLNDAKKPLPQEPYKPSRWVIFRDSIFG